MPVARVAVLLVLFMAGCASGHAGAGAEWIGVEVDNDVAPPAGIVVYIVGNGRRQLLGDVPPGQRRRLRFRESAPRGQYVLEAELRGERVRSQPIALRSRDELVWQVRENSLRVREPHAEMRDRARP